MNIFILRTNAFSYFSLQTIEVYIVASQNSPFSTQNSVFYRIFQRENQIWKCKRQLSGWYYKSLSDMRTEISLPSINFKFAGTNRPEIWSSCRAAVCSRNIYLILKFDWMVCVLKNKEFNFKWIQWTLFKFIYIL